MKNDVVIPYKTNLSQSTTSALCVVLFLSCVVVSGTNPHQRKLGFIRVVVLFLALASPLTTVRENPGVVTHGVVSHTARVWTPKGVVFTGVGSYTTGKVHVVVAVGWLLEEDALAGLPQVAMGAGDQASSQRAVQTLLQTPSEAFCPCFFLFLYVTKFNTLNSDRHHTYQLQRFLRTYMACKCFTTCTNSFLRIPASEFTALSTSTNHCMKI